TPWTGSSPAAMCRWSGSGGSGIFDILMAKTDISPASRPRRVRIAVIGYEGCSVWFAAGILELFAIANLPRPADGRRRVLFDCVTISATGRTVRASHGVRLPSAAPDRSSPAVIPPPLWSGSLAEFAHRANAVQKLAPLLRRL